VSPSATPIGQMMEVRHWIQELQRTAQIDPQTGFIAGIERFLPQSIGPHDQAEISRNIAKELRPLLDKILTTLQHKITKLEKGGQKVDQILRDQIYKLTCRLIEKILLKELKKSQTGLKEVLDACLRILANPVFIKSMLIYAVQIQFYL
jgi:hypothetical protein